MLAKFIAQYEQGTERTVAKFVGAAHTTCDITRTIENERAAMDHAQCLDIARKVSCVEFDVAEDIVRVKVFAQSNASTLSLLK